MTRAPWVLLCMIGLGGCEERSAPAENRAEQPHTGRKGSPNNAEVNLRVLLADIAEARACAQVRNTFHGLRASDAPETVAGDLWIRTCEIDAHGTDLDFHFEGDGWQRIDRETKKIGATFGVHDYVRFHMAATLHGTLDFAYAPGQHVATVWFKPTRSPDVKFEQRGKIPIDEKGIWSSIVGTLATVIGQAPEKKAEQQVKTEGQKAFVSKLDDGMTITVNACTGSTRSQFGILGPGKMAPLDVGDTMKIAVELHRGGLMIFGPEYVTKPFSIDVRAAAGPVHVAVACLPEANRLAEAYLADEQLPDVKTIVAGDISGRRSLEIPKTSCPVAVFAQSDAGTVSLSWKREPPPGAALVQCAPEKKHSEQTVPHAPATPHNTPAAPTH